MPTYLEDLEIYTADNVEVSFSAVVDRRYRTEVTPHLACDGDGDVSLDILTEADWDAMRYRAEDVAAEM